MTADCEDTTLLPYPNVASDQPASKSENRPAHWFDSAFLAVKILSKSCFVCAGYIFPLHPPGSFRDRMRSNTMVRYIKSHVSAILLSLGLAISGCSGMQVSTSAEVVALTNPDEALHALARTREFVAKDGDTVWPGYAGAHFGIVLIEANREVLLCDNRVPQGFEATASEPVTGCTMALGPRSWRAPQMLAAMPVFGPPSVIVMGRPEGVGIGVAEWQVVLLHEHFHQWQSELPDYYDRVEALGLSGGDKTGMWMLEYPFPYKDAGVEETFIKTRDALLTAYAAIGTQEFESLTRSYLQERAAFARSVSENDWLYAEFQLWQEGIARWSEIVIGSLHPDEAVQASARARALYTLEELKTAKIADLERISFYAMGAVEGFVLDAYRPNWRKSYVMHLAIGPLFR